MADASSIIRQLKSITNNTSSFSASEAERLEILNLCRKVAVSLESPFETMQRIAYSVSLSSCHNWLVLLV
jgi:hypothetical protein